MSKSVRLINLRSQETRWDEMGHATRHHGTSVKIHYRVPFSVKCSPRPRWTWAGRQHRWCSRLAQCSGLSARTKYRTDSFASARCRSPVWWPEPRRRREWIERVLIKQNDSLSPVLFSYLSNLNTILREHGIVKGHQSRLAHSSRRPRIHHSNVLSCVVLGRQCLSHRQGHQ